MNQVLGVDPQEFLQKLFQIAVSAADPAIVLPEHLPAAPPGKTIVIGAGKAAASMAKAVEDNWKGDISGLVVTRYQHGLKLKSIEVVEAAHPVPDQMGYDVAVRMLSMVENLSVDDLVICLISGGASSLLTLPPESIPLSEKRNINRALLKSGASISEMNCVRKHLSLIKGGRLAAKCSPAKVVTLSISDVPGDCPSTIGSGPTVYDSSTANDALNILKRYDISVSEKVLDWLKSPDSESLKSETDLLHNNIYQIIARPQQSLDAAAQYCRNAGFNCIVLSDEVEGEARDVAKVHAAIARQVAKCNQPIPAPCVILSGG